MSFVSISNSQIEKLPFDASRDAFWVGRVVNQLLCLVFQCFQLIRMIVNTISCFQNWSLAYLSSAKCDSQLRPSQSLDLDFRIQSGLPQCFLSLSVSRLVSQMPTTPNQGSAFWLPSREPWLTLPTLFLSVANSDALITANYGKSLLVCGSKRESITYEKGGSGVLVCSPVLVPFNTGREILHLFWPKRSSLFLSLS